MIASIRCQSRRWLMLGLVVALMADGGVLSALGNPAKDVGPELDRQRGSPMLQAERDEGDDDDDACDIKGADEDDDGYCANQVIVRLQNPADIDAVNSEFETETIDAIDGQPVFLLRLTKGSEEGLAEDLERDSRVVWAELNYVGQAPEGRPRRFYLRGGGAPRPANLDHAYAPQLLGVPAAEKCVNGKGISIAVIDSGLDADHPAFRNTVLRDAWNAFSGRGGLGQVADLGNRGDDDGDGLVDEMTGHGTHVAGIVVQVAPRATIVPIKALDSDGVGQAFYLARAIYYAIGQDVEVVNLSLGSTYDSRVVREAITDAVQAGVFLAAAAGNSGGSAPREYPATYRSVFGVAATDARDRPARFTSVHSTLDLSAPGDNIVSAFPHNQPPDNQLDSDYARWSGTSMATAWVSGTAALLIAQNPERSPANVAFRLRKTAAPIDGEAAGMGSGRLDVAAVACDGRP